jgi:hypothetical protein
MANPNAQYDFTQNHLTGRLRLMGIVMLIAGILDVGLSIFAMSIAAGERDILDGLSVVSFAFIMILGVFAIAIGVMTMMTPSKPNLARPTIILSLVFSVVCAVAMIAFLAVLHAGRDLAIAAIAGIVVGLCIYALIDQGKIRAFVPQGNPGQPGQANQPGQAWQANQPGQPGQVNQAGQPVPQNQAPQPVQANQPTQPTQPAQPTQSNQVPQQNQPDQPNR